MPRLTYVRQTFLCFEPSSCKNRKSKSQLSAPLRANEQVELARSPYRSYPLESMRQECQRALNCRERELLQVRSPETGRVASQ